MNVRIAHLKAPWPDGAVIGDVIALDPLPAWAVGKCVATDEEVTLAVDLPAHDDEAEAQAQADAAVADAEGQADEERAAIEAAQPATTRKARK